jgi:hypothetical protein
MNSHMARRQSQDLLIRFGIPTPNDRTKDNGSLITEILEVAPYSN